MVRTLIRGQRSVQGKTSGSSRDVRSQQRRELVPDLLQVSASSTNTPSRIRPLLINTEVYAATWSEYRQSVQTSRQCELRPSGALQSQYRGGHSRNNISV
ncbi:uncharacterized protein EKO05_0002990 [Ascochyta rabiei]|uniref:uncharacterized protein n=1 Tax=Didymella rabiei TaxID=5454 RepID=UPI0022003F55|nr:uncharacterized protein EKO05_0002990 [Ascochyta rabiei]UPX12443.1 hypothetical protein EKO05_0002990 [Ascochyta rabiei]